MRNSYLKMYMLVCALILTSSMAFAQAGTITGKVLDENKQPLPGATVAVGGTTIAGGTDINGVYRLSGVKPGTYSLTANFIGYTVATQQVTVSSGTTTVTFNMQPAAKNLNEVVVIGYGTQRKKDLTGSITTVSSKDFQKGEITTPEQLISGKVAGVSITSNGGAPGSGSTIRIRGGASLNASNDPLIVIDGVQLSNDGISGVANPLSLINPNDIETFTVLKDASATAIYGSRASNGVILITTKKGSSGAPVINFNTQFSLGTLPKEVPVLTGDQIRTYVNANGNATAKSLLGTANTDWQKQIYQTAIATDNNLSVSGATKNLPYRVSVGYLDQNGILKTGNLQRTSAAINLSPSFFTNHLKININLKGSYNKSRFANESAIGGSVTFDPTKPVYSGNNRFGGYYEWLDPTNKTTGLKALAPLNPLGLLEQNQNNGIAERSIGNIQFDYKFHFLPELHANLNAGYDVSNGHGTTFVPDSAASNYHSFPDATGVYRNGYSSQYKTTVNNKTFEFYLNYVKDIKSIKSRIDATAGYAFYDYVTNVTNFPSYSAGGILNPLSIPTYPNDRPEHTLLSYYGRLNYTFNEKYLLTGTIRDDASSRFGSNHRYGVFPSVALAWRIKDESFLKDSRVVSDLKLRLGYGLTGQQDGLNNYGYVTFYTQSNSTAQYQFGNSYYSLDRPTVSDPNRKWEQSATTNAGLDYGFLNNRISGAIDVYYKNTTDLLSYVALPAGSGFGNANTINIGDMVNRGVEFSINTQIVRSKNVSWDVNFNATYNQNKITKLNNYNLPSYAGVAAGGISGGTGNNIQIQTVGYTKNSFYAYQQVYGADGRPLDGVFVDRNGDGTINESDLYRYKSPDPKFFYGLSSNVSYKNFNAGFVMRANVGNYNYNNVFSSIGTARNIINPIGIIGNASTNFLASGLSGASDKNALSDYYIQNASFLRMDNANIGYTFSGIGHKSSKLNVSFTVQNVFVVTKYQGLDPEVNNNGIDNNFYPRPRTFIFGLNYTY